jgi:mono/diheme cytochrome c family protein
MTNAQKWVISALCFFLLLLFIEIMTKKEDQTVPQMPGQMSQQQSSTSSDADGLTLINQNGCIGCHGPELNGSAAAPALTSIKQYWTHDKLINYLRNPSSYSGDPRFDEYRSKYNAVMPSFSNIDVKDLGKIADYLLTR